MRQLCTFAASPWAAAAGALAGLLLAVVAGSLLCATGDHNDGSHNVPAAPHLFAYPQTGPQAAGPSAPSRHGKRAAAAQAPAADASRALRLAFAASTDLRAFVAQARTRPHEGGGFFALRALAECRLHDPQAVASENGQRSHGELWLQQQRTERSARRCAGFLDDELSDQALDQTRADALAAADPLLSAHERWLDAVTAADYDLLQHELERIFALRDPQLIELAIATGADYLSGGDATGEPIDATARRRVLDAWRLVPCALGDSCEASDLRSHADCLASGRCSADRWDAVFADGGWATPQDRAALVQLVARLADAVRRNDAASALGLRRGESRPRAH